MQIKILIIGLLISCSYLVGDYIYKIYLNRHKQINDLIRILEIIRMDISFGLYTLEEVFSRLSNNIDSDFSYFFKSMHKDLSCEQSKGLDQILDDNLLILKKDTYLEEREIEEIKKLILTLGKSDVDSQERMIYLSVEKLKKINDCANEDINKKGIVYKKLSTLVGIAIGIILV